MYSAGESAPSRRGKGAKKAALKENVSNPSTTAPHRLGPKQSRRPSKHSKKNGHVDLIEDEQNIEEETFKMLSQKFDQIDNFQLEERVEVILPPVIQPNRAKLANMRASKMIKTRGLAIDDSEDTLELPSSGSRASPPNLALSSSVIPNTDGSSQTPISDTLPDSDTFFEEAPIASNNDFELPNETTSGTTTLSNPTSNQQTNLNIDHSVVSEHPMDIEVATSESVGSLATRRAANNFARDISSFLFNEFVQPEAQSMIEDEDYEKQQESQNQKANQENKSSANDNQNLNSPASNQKIHHTRSQRTSTTPKTTTSKTTTPKTTTLVSTSARNSSSKQKMSSKSTTPLKEYSSTKSQTFKNITQTRSLQKNSTRRQNEADVDMEVNSPQMPRRSRRLSQTPSK